MIPSAAWVSIIVTLALFVLTHIVITVWWASRVNTLLDMVQGELKDIVVELKATRGLFVTKEELAYRIATSDKEHAAMWKQLDDLKRK